MVRLSRMRDQLLVLPFGSQPRRKFFLTFLAMIVALFALIILTAPVARAQATTTNNKATWSGNSINYDGRQYIHIGEAKVGDSHNIPEGSQIYAFIEPAPGGNQNTSRKAHIIYFTPGTDPPTATSATLITYDFSGGVYSNPSGNQNITIDPRTGNPGTSSCDDGTFLKGIGWIVCPVTNFLASAMDSLFGILSNFLAVRPAQTGQDNALYRAWSFMRNFANISFVIAFIVIIYSQLSGVGISSYGIKKVFPRLIIAAILVNISYWICSVAIDLSNIAGFSLQDVFISIRNSLVGTEGNSWDVVSWESITGFILSSGTAAVAGGIGLYALAAGSVGGAIYMLLPILVGVVLAVLVALLVMALRQAIITIMVVVSPLAFVAFLLPGTAKYFEKWKDLFMTMLVMFPIFSVVFGGSQLAGILIIQNADSINLIILGMAVQVAPVVITPLLVRFSGSLIGRIAGMVNNPNKGLIDRTRNWSQRQKDEHKARVLGNTPKKGIRGFTARRTQNIERRRRKGQEWKAANEAFFDANWHNSKDYSKIHAAGERAHMLKERGEASAQTHANHLKTMGGHQMQTDAASLHAAKLGEDASKARLEAMYGEMQAGHGHAGLGAQIQSAQEASREIALNSMRKQAAERTQKSQLTQDLLSNQAIIDGQHLREYAGGIRGEEGANSVLASSVASYREEYGKMVGEKNQLIKHFQLDSNARQRLAEGEDVKAEKGNVKYTFRADDEYAREAAIEVQMKTGSEAQIINLIRESGAIKDAAGNILVKGKTYDYRTTISEDIPSNGIPGKSLIFGAKSIDDVYQGNLYGDEGLNNAAVYHIMDGKIRDDVLAVQGAGTLKILYETYNNRHNIPQYVNASAEKKQIFEENYQAMRRSAGTILKDKINRNTPEASRRVFEEFKIDPPEPGSQN